MQEEEVDVRDRTMNDNGGATPKVEAFLLEMRIDLRKEDYCSIYLLIEFDGPPPEPFKVGWHWKDFPKGIGLPHILANQMADHMTWPIKDPPDEDGSERPHIFIPGRD